MLDIRFVRENPELVKENIKKKFQDHKLPMVDEVLALDEENRSAQTRANELRAARNTLSKQVGMLMGQAKKDPSKLEEAEAVKAQVKANADELAALEAKETELAEANARLEQAETALTDVLAVVQTIRTELNAVAPVEEAPAEENAAEDGNKPDEEIVKEDEA